MGCSCNLLVLQLNSERASFLQLGKVLTPVWIRGKHFIFYIFNVVKYLQEVLYQEVFFFFFFAHVISSGTSSFSSQPLFLIYVNKFTFVKFLLLYTQSLSNSSSINILMISYFFNDCLYDSRLYISKVMQQFLLAYMTQNVPFHIKRVGSNSPLLEFGQFCNCRNQLNAAKITAWFLKQNCKRQYSLTLEHFHQCSKQPCKQSNCLETLCYREVQTSPCGQVIWPNNVN